MNICPISLELVAPPAQFSSKALRALSRQIETLRPLPFSQQMLRDESLKRMDKMSIQGVQQKLSAIFSAKEQTFQLVDSGGQYILKPPSLHYPDLPQNEALTMTLAKSIGLIVPFHGLVLNQDDSFTYFIKRFDRLPKQKKLACEDLAQLSNANRKTKYRSSMEKVADIICNPTLISFPKLEAIKLFKLTLFNYLVGNEDAHLKNFSVITEGPKVSLSPVYDLLNTTIALKNAKEEIALPLHGKKNNLSAKDFFSYYASERLKLSDASITSITKQFKQAISQWPDWVDRSYLSLEMKVLYKDLIYERMEKLGFFYN